MHVCVEGGERGGVIGRLIETRAIELNVTN